MHGIKVYVRFDLIAVQPQNREGYLVTKVFSISTKILNVLIISLFVTFHILLLKFIDSTLMIVLDRIFCQIFQMLKKQCNIGTR